MLDKWKLVLGLDNWNIISQPISREQVLFPECICEGDKYFIGIVSNAVKKTAIIYYDRTLTDKDILHELLHIKFPNENQNFINYYTKVIYNNIMS